ncbi:MAG: hypothetical protein P8N09_07640 [Planctomycetota bacterium]|nr:hypothetical protein [Planctomycetota bacterium]
MAIPTMRPVFESDSRGARLLAFRELFRSLVLRALLARFVEAVREDAAFLAGALLAVGALRAAGAFLTGAVCLAGAAVGEA